MVSSALVEGALRIEREVHLSIPVKRRIQLVITLVVPIVLPFSLTIFASAII